MNRKSFSIVFTSCNFSFRRFGNTCRFSVRGSQWMPSHRIWPTCWPWRRETQMPTPHTVWPHGGRSAGGPRASLSGMCSGGLLLAQYDWPSQPPRLRQGLSVRFRRQLTAIWHCSQSVQRRVRVQVEASHLWSAPYVLHRYVVSLKTSKFLPNRSK